MAFRIVRSQASTEDLRIIFRHLIDSYVALGDDLPQAADRALRRMDALERDLQLIARAPHQGTVTSYPGFEGVRHVTKNKVVFYFQIHATQKVLRLLAVFFGGQDHQRHMLKRLSQAVLLRLLVFRADTPLCPAGHLPHKGGERGGVGLLPEG